jgi:hypothetical protein
MDCAERLEFTQRLKKVRMRYVKRVKDWCAYRYTKIWKKV